MRLSVPALAVTTEHSAIKEMFESIRGIVNVRIEPIVQSLVINYDQHILNSKNVLRYVGLFFQSFDGTNPMMLGSKKKIAADLLRSFISGALLIAAFLRKHTKRRPDAFDYLVVISTSYTVLSHGENKLSHPDVITGIISMLSLGAENILQVAMVTWVVNLLEVFNDMRRSSLLLQI